MNDEDKFLRELKKMAEHFERPPLQPKPPGFGRLLAIVAGVVVANVIGLGLFIWACRQIHSFVFA